MDMDNGHFSLFVMTSLKCLYCLQDFHAWYLHGVEIVIQTQFFYFTTFSPRNRASKFALQPRPSRLAKGLGLVSGDVKTGRIGRKPLMSTRLACSWCKKLYSQANQNFHRGQRDLEKNPFCRGGMYGYCLKLHNVHCMLNFIQRFIQCNVRSELISFQCHN